MNVDFNAQEFRDTLRAGLSEWGLVLGEAELLQLERFALQIAEVNQTLNLTRHQSPVEMALKNVLDSLSCLLLELPGRLSCLDLGAGAGFPGIPLAICRPGWSVVLLDARKKRVDFLEQACGLLGLENASALHGRAEDVGREQGLRGRCELVVSRAVASLPVLLELAVPLVQVGGHFVAYKGSEAVAEITESKRAMAELNIVIEQVFPLELPLGLGRRNLLVFKKNGSTPRLYPRRAGLPAKRPLV